MIKVFEDFSYSLVGQMQSLLESHGIQTFMRNEFGSSVIGELPFVEVIPQLFVLEDRDESAARRLIASGLPAQTAATDWTCSGCGEEIEGSFESCWNCGTGRSDPAS
jgi:hypothetical protein